MRCFTNCWEDPLKKFWTVALGGVLAAALVACGDEETATPAGTGTAGAVTSATAAASSVLKLDTSFGTNGIAATPLTSNAHDRFMAIAVAPDGKTYAAGFITENGDQAMAVARLDAQGALDKTFGKDGVASVNVAVGGKTAELARAIAIQSSGKIIIGGPVERDPTAAGDAGRDTDVAVARFDNTGKLDTAFGRNGIATVDFGTGRVTTGTTFVADTSWGLGSLAGDKVVIFGSKLADGADRVDTDFILVGLTAAGTVDTAFGTNGRTVLDVSKVSDNPRNLLVQADGKIAFGGYSSINDVLQPVIIRTSADGKLDTTFGTGGYFTDAVLPGVAEVYSLGMQGNNYVFAGYGRGADTAEKVDMLVARVTSDGKWDKTFGTSGVARVDIAKDDDRARTMVMLPDGRILGVGSGKKNATNIDAMVVLFTKDGQLDKSFGDGGTLISDLGGPADGWWGVALSADKKHIYLAGYKGTDATSGGNDDAVVARLSI